MLPTLIGPQVGPKCSAQLKSQGRPSLPPVGFGWAKCARLVFFLSNSLGAGGSCREATRIYLNDSKFASDPNLLRIIPRDSGGWFQDSVLEFPSWLMSRFSVERNHNVTRFSPCVPSTAQTTQRHSQNTPCDNLNSTNMQCVTCLFCSVAWHLHVTCSM